MNDKGNTYNSGRRNFLGIFSFNRANKPPNISRKLKLKIPRKFRRITRNTFSSPFLSSSSGDLSLLPAISPFSRDDLSGSVSLGIFRRQLPRNILRDIGPRTIPTDTLPRNFSTAEVRRNILGIFNFRYSLRILRGNSEEILLSDEKVPTTILVGMSSEYLYSEDIPTILVVGIPVFSCSDRFIDP
ncbi:hypothetical protein IGI04_030392 [Brassica rapa subsp. trilocularis]|uniref:Uncharacterized protein n=1 Tax=Brassica rapa subsp. trilocularis TaxID=1813537 RepID=A0ABQ7LUJ1_BRACM|nr:hypothetical protein IGI04_030392 [Brassica rapa subsp. trilocularis]